jgi:hypothetical protein
MLAEWWEGDRGAHIAPQTRRASPLHGSPLPNACEAAPRVGVGEWEGMSAV